MRAQVSGASHRNGDECKFKIKAMPAKQIVIDFCLFYLASSDVPSSSGLDFSSEGAGWKNAV